MDATITQDVDDMLDNGLIDKAVKHLPPSYVELEKMSAPYTKQGILLIVDDGLSQLESYLPQVFEEFTSKNNRTIFFVSQATCLDSANFRRLSENSHYVVCLRNKRNATKIRTLAFQAAPCNHNFVINCYKDATKPKPLVNDKQNSYGYGYLLFDFSVSSPEVLNLRSNIFPNEKEPVCVYIEDA